VEYSYEELAKMIDHSLLHRAMTDEELEAGCRVAARYRVASRDMRAGRCRLGQDFNWLRFYQGK
jgi:deoxyribose-phosphate aldolase